MKAEELKRLAQNFLDAQADAKKHGLNGKWALRLAEARTACHSACGPETIIKLCDVVIAAQYACAEFDDDWEHGRISIDDYDAHERLNGLIKALEVDCE